MNRYHSNVNNVDLHCHSTASDGLLSPAELVRRAHANGVDMLALTDHDETAGLAEAAEEARGLGLRLISGVEISVTWSAHTVHVVGLGIDAANPTLATGLAWVRGSRKRRAGRIAEELAKLGIAGSLQGAMGYAENPELIGRKHFARFLAQMNYARDVKSVFQQYLVRGKPGYVPQQWASLADAVSWINASGGLAVVAHPGRYKLSPEETRMLLREFRDCAGKAIEVLTGSHTPEQYKRYVQLARETGLAASRGSDFHGPGESKVELGALPQLPDGIKRVWDLLEC